MRFLGIVAFDILTILIISLVVIHSLSLLHQNDPRWHY